MNGEIEGTAAVLEFDVEGHAFSLHFPTAKDADAFKRGVLTGALAATLVVGGAAGAATLASQGHAAAVPVAVTTQQTIVAPDADHPESVSLTQGGTRAPDADHPESVSLTGGMSAPDADHPESVPINAGTPSSNDGPVQRPGWGPAKAE